MQLTIGLLAPTVVQAAWETGLFDQHQRQRRMQGLPTESGWQASLYAAVGDIVASCDALVLLAAGWVLLGTLWQLSVGLPGM